VFGSETHGIKFCRGKVMFLNDAGGWWGVNFLTCIFIVKIIIRAEFYDTGFKEIEFDVAGFKWDH
jgi:hypothetical protein